MFNKPLDKPMFWATLIFGLSLFYVIAAVIALRGDTHHWSVSLSLILLGLHVLEMPMAWFKLRALKPSPIRFLVLTLLYGLLWWVPASRGLNHSFFRVR
ncbi:hypothetical protein [Hydrocarboniphaga sp.]|uniref:hypothetical protein n=1 Tax=Hydrocarboniphaga sp. TaxID=2033016 RepID=UPI003D105336